MQIQNILIPIDFSDNSVNALEWGCKIAKLSNASLHILHVYEYTATYAQVNYLAFMKTIAETVEKNLRKDMKKFAAEICHLSGIKVSYNISFEYTIKGIKDYANDHSIDFIVMGTRGNNDITNKLMGSITHSIIEDTEIPVLAIPEGYAPRDTKQMTFAEDFAHKTPVQALGLINKAAKLFGSSVKILHVSKSTPGGDIKESEEARLITREFKDLDHTYEFVVNKEPYKGILEYLEDHKENLLVMIPRKHGLLFTLFKESVTEQVVHRIKVPLLAIQDYHSG